MSSESAPARALLRARDEAVERSRRSRGQQDAARSKELAAERALEDAKAAYAAATAPISVALAEISELQAAYRKLTGQDMPPPQGGPY